MSAYHSLADDFYVSMNLSTEMELTGSREAILHYFEQMQKRFPELRNFYARDKGDFVLEADKEGGSYRWCSVEARRIWGDEQLVESFRARYYRRIVRRRYSRFYHNSLAARWPSCIHFHPDHGGV